MLVHRMIRRMDTDRIQKLANHFRLAIEACPKGQLPITFKSFPRGSCGDTSLILGAWLEDNEYPEFEYTLGTISKSSGQLSSHAWLEKNSLIVDITADQFDLGMPSVYVGLPNDFYNRYTVKQRSIGHFRAYDKMTQLTLASAYNTIKQHILGSV